MGKYGSAWIRVSRKSEGAAPFGNVEESGLVSTFNGVIYATETAAAILAAFVKKGNKVWQKRLDFALELNNEEFREVKALKTPTGWTAEPARLWATRGEPGGKVEYRIQKGNDPIREVALEYFRQEVLELVQLACRIRTEIDVAENLERAAAETAEAAE